MSDPVEEGSVPVVRRRGRPASGEAKSGAERMRARRERLKAEGMVELSVHIPVDVMSRLDEFLKFKDETKEHVVERALRAFLRKR